MERELVPAIEKVINRSAAPASFAIIIADLAIFTKLQLFLSLLAFAFCFQPLEEFLLIYIILAEKTISCL